MGTHDYRVRQDCRLCGGLISRVLDLGSTPPANELVTREFVDSGAVQDTFPLFLSACHTCGHVQLPVVVSPDRLFRNYVYVSGTSPVFVEHFSRYADRMIADLGLKKGDLVIDVGSNDGTLLHFFRKAGMRVLGVDPAVSIAAEATAGGIPTIPDFLTVDLARSIVAEHGHAKLVTANNVFAHADDLSGVAHSVKHLIGNVGHFAFEVSYLPSVVSGTLFDTIYHEHTSYHHLEPAVRFLGRHGMYTVDAELIDTHGGSIRVLAAGTPGVLSDRALSILRSEADLGFTSSCILGGLEESPISKLDSSISDLRARLVRLLSDVRAAGKTVAGFGAPAKVTTLMHRFGLGSSDVDFIIDDAPLKQGLYTPGKYVPILPSSALYERRPDYVIVLAWNFAPSIMKKHQRYMDEGGTFVVPIPDLTIHGK